MKIEGFAVKTAQEVQEIKNAVEKIVAPQSVFCPLHSSIKLQDTSDMSWVGFLTRNLEPAFGVEARRA